MELFRAEKVAEGIHSPSTGSTKRCRFCGETPELMRKMLDMDTGHILQIYECQCGDRTWDDGTGAPVFPGDIERAI